VNSAAEHKRILQIVSLYLPDLVVEKAPDGGVVTVMGRKNSGKIEDLIIDLISEKKDDEKVEPAPKMIQIVANFVKFSENYAKSFNFSFAPVISAQTGAGQQSPTTSVGETAALVNNLLPKLNWAKYHGYAKVLDTASILVQDKISGSLTRTVTNTSLVAGQNGALQVNPLPPAQVELSVTPTIKSERSGLVELSPLSVRVNSLEPSNATSTTIRTAISVRDRQSAAFGGIIKKDTDTRYGSPANSDAIITLQASKDYDKNNSQFVVFITPIIKSSASSGVEQVKKKFRLRD
jgi:pilus assembly protein CpaC